MQQPAWAAFSLEWYPSPMDPLYRLPQTSTCVAGSSGIFLRHKESQVIDLIAILQTPLKYVLSYCIIHY